MSDKPRTIAECLEEMAGRVEGAREDNAGTYAIRTAQAQFKTAVEIAKEVYNALCVEGPCGRDCEGCPMDGVYSSDLNALLARAEGKE